MSLKGRKVIVGLTGGIACYKVPYLVRFLRKADAEVRVIMTRAAARFITPLTLETVSDNPVAVEMFPEGEYVATRHIDLAGWPGLVVIAPATADFLGKVAHGICDDLLTTVVCATAQPLMIAPAMNPRMWANKVTQRNRATLQELGHQFIGPREGETACKQYGVGRMAEPEEIFEAVKSFFAKQSKKKVLKGKRILVTAGPTHEALDPVRFLTNRSSGKMGYALAEAAVQLGAEVTLISGPTDLTAPPDVKFVSIESTGELLKAVRREFRSTDCLIMAAAPADFAPRKKAARKMKKSPGGVDIALKLTVDILKEITRLKRSNQVVVGFALETDNAMANARKKLKDKKLDMIVLNTPSADTGFDHDTNEVTLLAPGKRPVTLPLTTKSAISFELLDRISTML